MTAKYLSLGGAHIRNVQLSFSNEGKGRNEDLHGSSTIVPVARRDTFCVSFACSKLLDILAKRYTFLAMLLTDISAAAELGLNGLLVLWKMGACWVAKTTAHKFRFMYGYSITPNGFCSSEYRSFLGCTVLVRPLAIL